MGNFKLKVRFLWQDFMVFLRELPKKITNLSKRAKIYSLSVVTLILIGVICFIFINNYKGDKENLLPNGLVTEFIYSSKFSLNNGKLNLSSVDAKVYYDSEQSVYYIMGKNNTVTRKEPTSNHSKGKYKYTKLPVATRAISYEKLRAKQEKDGSLDELETYNENVTASSYEDSMGYLSYLFKEGYTGVRYIGTSDYHDIVVYNQSTDNYKRLLILKGQLIVSDIEKPSARDTNSYVLDYIETH